MNTHGSSEGVCMPITPIPLICHIQRLAFLCVSLALIQIPVGDVMADDAVEIVAHRGASADCPENTLAAFQEAWRQGADAIEGDFRLTSDGHVVCLHDATLRRTGGDQRRVADMTLDEVRSLDVGSWKDARFKNERVPHLGDVLAALPTSKRLFIEIKVGPEIIPALAQAFDSTEIETKQLVVISFNADVIKALKEVRPHIRAMLLSSFKKQGSRFVPSIETLIRQARAVNADGISVQGLPEVVSAEFVDQADAEGLEVHVWTVDDVVIADRLRAAGVRSITTNRPGIVRRSMGLERP